MKMILTWTMVFLGHGLGTKEAQQNVVMKDSPLSSKIIFACSYVSTISGDDCIPDNISSFNSGSIDIAAVLKKITDAISSDNSEKIYCNFFPYECDFPEAVFKAITKSDSVRYILYTKKQLNQLVAAYSDWVAYSIFAHEIGHHFYGHSLSAPKDLEESRKRELEADFFSGFILYKLKATLLQAQSGINSISSHPSKELEPMCTHPAKQRRLDAIQNGFEYASSATSTIRSMLNINSLSTKTGLENIFNKSLLLMFEKRFDDAIKEIDELIANYPEKHLAVYYNNRGFIKLMAGSNFGAIKDFQKAININDKNADFFNNLGAAKITTNDVFLKAESREDLKKAQNLIKEKLGKVELLE